MPCSGDLGEMTEAERVNDLRLHRCGLRIHGIGTERRADHGTRGPAALWLCHEPCDGLSDVMRVWRIGGLERRHEVLEYGAGNLAHSEEDVLSYALFPDIAKEFFLAREAGAGQQVVAHSNA